MRIIIFGTVIRTRKSLEKIMIQAAKEGRTNAESFHWAVGVYNTGIFGLLFYRITRNCVGKKYFIDKAEKL